MNRLDELARTLHLIAEPGYMSSSCLVAHSKMLAVGAGLCRWCLCKGSAPCGWHSTFLTHLMLVLAWPGLTPLLMLC